MQLPKEVRGIGFPRNWDKTIKHEHWELNSGPLVEQNALLTNEPSFLFQE